RETGNRRCSSWARLKSPLQVELDLPVLRKVRVIVAPHDLEAVRSEKALLQFTIRRLAPSLEGLHLDRRHAFHGHHCLDQATEIHRLAKGEIVRMEETP